MVRTTPTKSPKPDIKPIVNELMGTRNRNATKWTGKDRRLLFAYIERCGAGNWTAAAIGVPGKTAKQCKDQWIKTLSPYLRKACQNA